MRPPGHLLLVIACVLVVAGCASAPTPAPTPTAAPPTPTPGPVDRVMAFQEAFNKGAVDETAAMFTDNNVGIILESLVLDLSPRGVGNILEYAAATGLKLEFSDCKPEEAAVNCSLLLRDDACIKSSGLDPAHGTARIKFLGDKINLLTTTMTEEDGTKFANARDLYYYWGIQHVPNLLERLNRSPGADITAGQQGELLAQLCKDWAATNNGVPAAAGPEPTAVGGDLALASRDAGLDKLKSYRVTWKADWEGTKDGKTEQANWDWLREYTSDPVGFRSVWKGADASGMKSGSWEHWSDGSTAGYVSIDPDGKKTCSSLWNERYFNPTKVNESTIPGLSFLPRMLGSLSGAKYAGTEVVNGIRSNRYKYDEKAANRTDLGKVSGEIWVAADGGYVVKDIVSWEGGAAPFGAPAAAGESGHGSWTWELTDPNGAITIPLLPGCDSATDGLPLISGGYQKTVTGDVMVYRAFHGEKVAPFYQEAMAAGGWKQSGEPASKDGVTTVEFTKDGQKASVTVTPKGQLSEVKIEVTKGQ